MKVGIIGARNRNEVSDKLAVKKQLIKLMSKHNITEIVSGGAKKGGDKFAEELAKELNIPIKIYLPEKASSRWEAAKNLLARNTDIINDSDFLIACAEKGVTKDNVQATKKGGTNDAVKKFLKKSPMENLFLV